MRFDSVMQRRTLSGLGELQAKSNVLTKSSLADGLQNTTCYEEQVITFKPYVGIGRIIYENRLSRRDGAIRTEPKASVRFLHFAKFLTV